jgi:hypothetical protein
MERDENMLIMLMMVMIVKAVDEHEERETGSSQQIDPQSTHTHTFGTLSFFSRSSSSSRKIMSL